MKNYNLKSVVKGDQKIPSISAASIIAKVTRDKMITNLGKKFKGYYLDKNSGYGTKQHLKAIKSLGITTEHRKTFSPINMPTNGIPPLRCGPFLNSEIQPKCLLICSEDTFSGNTDWLWQLENAVSKKTGLKLIVVSSQGSSDQLQNYVNYANSVGGIAAALIMTSSSDQISALSGFSCRSIVIGGDFSTTGYDVAIQKEEMTEQFAQKIAT